ncbi:hypothetical protein KR009_001297, partial [Drosophila setifemur]
GLLSLYDGFSAQLVRQLTYTTLRFHLYDLGKRNVDDCNFIHKVVVACLAGCVAGVVGIPTELVNTRMHVNRVLSKDKQWNYRNVFHGLYRVSKDEGWMALYKGCLYSCVRSALVTIGQNAAYDQAKEVYMRTFHYRHDNTFLHLISSVTAACAYVPITQPLENLRIRHMASSGRMSDFFTIMLRIGPRGLFRGVVPCVLRLVPNTIITFLMFEQFRLHFGYYE